MNKPTKKPLMRTLLMTGAASLVLVLSACADSSPVVDTGVNDTTVVDEGVVDDNVVDDTPAEDNVVDENVTEGDQVEQGATDNQAVAGATDKTAAGVVDAPDQFVQSSVLLDYDVETLTGDSAGEIEDMLVDLNNGDILFTQLEYGGFLDIGDSEPLVPLSAFTIGPAGGLILGMDEQLLEAYPEIDETAWGYGTADFGDPNWYTGLDTFWNNDVGVTTPTLAGRDMSNTAWVSNITGYPVFGWGTAATNVTDLLINLQSGRAEYALIGDTAGLGDGEYIVPIQALTFDLTNEQLVFEGEIDDNTLVNAPRFDTTAMADGTAVDGTIGDDIDNAWRDLGYDWWQ